MHGKKNGSTAQQDGARPSSPDGHADDQSAESAAADRGHNHQQPLSTAQVIDSAEGISKGRQTTDDTPQQVESLEEPGQDRSQHDAFRQISSSQNILRQQAPGAQPHDRSSHQESGHSQGKQSTSQQESGHPQEEQSTSQQESGHPHMQNAASLRGLSSRRRSLEQQSASLTLPFEQLNFVFHHINYSVPATVSMDNVKIQLLVYFVSVLPYSLPTENIKKAKGKIIL